jgi:ketopantoate reductase
VFMQNGYLDDFLESKGLLDDTQVLLYLSVTAKGVDAVDGVTTVNPDGLTAATGIHAQAFADRLAALDLKCNVVTPEEYRTAMFEKLMWISTYMLVGAGKECKSVGQAGAEYGELVENIVNDLVVAAVSKKEGITFSEGTMARLAAYTDVVTDFPYAVKEFEWRNKYFYDLGDDAVPTHNALLKECEEKGLLSFELPK